MASTMSDYDHLFKVLCIGDSATGKSSIVSRYTDEPFEKNFIATIGESCSLPAPCSLTTLLRTTNHEPASLTDDDPCSSHQIQASTSR